MSFISTDEIWATDDQYIIDRIIRKIHALQFSFYEPLTDSPVKTGQEVNKTFITNKARGEFCWMFWGSFMRTEDNPCKSCEKKWGPITSNFYHQTLAPLFHGILLMKLLILVVQDNAPSHTATRKHREFQERSISSIE